jgi:hypothetical protein
VAAYQWTGNTAYTVSPDQEANLLVPLFLMKMRMRSTENFQIADYCSKSSGRFQHVSVLSQRLYSAKQAILSAIHAPWLLVRQRRAVGSVRSQSCSVSRSQM